MTAIYEIRVKNRAGALQETLTGALGAPDADENSGYILLAYTRLVNGVGNGAFAIHADSAIVDFLDPNGVTLLDAQIEFWRRDADNAIDPYADFYGFLRDREYSTDDNGAVTFIAYLDEQQDYLRRSIVAYPENTSGRSLFEDVPAETVMKALVTYNATSAGTTGDGRDTNVDAWGAYLSVASDGAAGNNVTISCAGRNLLETLQEVAAQGGLDFWLTKTGAQSWEFRTGARLGDDHAADVKFSLPLGNMRRPNLRSHHRAEKTKAVVAGQDSGGGRAKSIRTGTNYHSTYNSFETFINGSRYDSSDGLAALGDQRLEEVRALDELSFDVIQVPATLYGKHYGLGDSVSALFRGRSYTPQITRVDVDVRDRGAQPPEQIGIVIADA